MAFFDPQRKQDFEFISGTKMRGKVRCIHKNMCGI
jgi:hypothetical protein